MPYIQYIDKRFRARTLAVIDQANVIIAEYQAQGFDLTLRQLYYQFVARGLMPNLDAEYDRLGVTINNARLAGLVDWDAIQDRTRNLRTLPSWDTPADIVLAAAQSFRVDMWEHQKFRPEVWIEKDALIGVIEGICNQLGVPHFAARGYNSQSEQWAAGQRFLRYAEAGQVPVVFHFGDHDPSGMDMTRDNVDRLELFTGGVEVKRLALNLDQVRQYNPPPNPAKLTDSRAVNYIATYGSQSWELDALEPQVLANLVSDAVLSVRDDAQWAEDSQRIEDGKRLLHNTANRWDEVEDLLT